MSPASLYKKVKSKVEDIGEYIDILDCLYALGKIELMLHSLAAQVDHYSTYIRHHHGWEYVGVYADEAKTGTRDSRENFQRMLTDCRAGKIEIKTAKLIQFDFSGAATF